ncbi:MAG: biotin--[acetyl-CoA-carboxylase] ligase [Flavobacteriales bacterium]|nr:biotin--[acetyl-CoA-carboxylase] ligase [Flavobacteriales bacterium]
MSITIGSEILHLDTVYSTNSYLLELAEKESVNEGLVVVAQDQTKGRGQRHNIWVSEPLKNITLSILVYPNIDISDHFFLNKLISIGLVDFIKDLVDMDVSIKWPNDIYVGDGKIAGILIESKVSGKNVSSSVLGLGININQTEFDSSLRNPTSVFNITGRSINIDTCISSLCRSLETQYAKLKGKNKSEIEEQYESLLYRKNTFHEYVILGKVYIAKILGVDPIGKLILQSNTEEMFLCDLKEVEYQI